MANGRRVHFALDPPENHSTVDSSSGSAAGCFVKRLRGRPPVPGASSKSTKYRQGFRKKDGIWIKPQAAELVEQTKFVSFPKPPSEIVSRTTFNYRLLYPMAPDEVAEMLGSGYDKDISVRQGTLNGNRVALAEMNMFGSEEDKRQRLIRLRREFSLCKFVNSETERVVRVFDYCEVDTRNGKQAKWTMACAERSLSSYASELRQSNGNGMLSRGQARLVLRQSAEALRELHAARCNVAHRDVKGDNFLVFPGAEIRLADLGFATVAARPLSGRYGTKRFFPPEMLRWNRHDKSVDAWAYSRMAVELLYGYPYALDANRLKQQNGGAESWNTTNRKLKKLQYKQIEHYVEWLTLAGVPPLELSLLSRSDLRGFASLLEDVGRYWPGERLSFECILRAPIFMEPQNGIEIVCLTVPENNQTANLELLVGSHSVTVTLQLNLGPPECVNAALRELRSNHGNTALCEPTMRSFLEASHKSAIDIRKARSFRHNRRENEVNERIQFLHYLRTVSDNRKQAILKSDGLENKPPLPVEEVERMFDALVGEDESSSDDDIHIDEESDRPMSYDDEVVAST